MAEPFCTIEWHGEGRQQIRLFDGADLTADTEESICREVAQAAFNANSIAALKGAVSGVAERRGLRGEWLKGGHADPLDQIAAFTLWPESP